MPEPTSEMRPVSVESPGNDGFRYEPVPERTPPDDTTEGLRERMAEAIQHRLGSQLEMFPRAADQLAEAALSVRDEEMERLRAELAAYTAAAQSADIEGDARDHFHDLADWETPNGATPGWLVDAVMGFVAPHVCAASAAEVARDQAEAERDEAQRDLTTAQGQVADYRATLKRVTEEHQAEMDARLRRKALGRSLVEMEGFAQRETERADWAETERDALKTANDRVRELHQTGGDPTGEFCRECDYRWPCPTLAALEAPTTTTGMTDDYIYITYGPWDSSGHQCGDLVVDGCNEPVPLRLVTVHYSIGSEQLLGSELGDCPNGCRDAPGPPGDTPAKLKHVGGRANAEDCPACDTSTMPYPWICPSEPETSGDAETEDQS